MPTRLYHRDCLEGKVFPEATAALAVAGWVDTPDKVTAAPPPPPPLPPPPVETPVGGNGLPKKAIDIREIPTPEIRAMLPGLPRETLERIRNREATGEKPRQTVLALIDARIKKLDAETAATDPATDQAAQ